MVLNGKLEFAASYHALSGDGISMSPPQLSNASTIGEAGFIIPIAVIRTFFHNNCNFSTKKVSNKPQV